MAFYEAPTQNLGIFDPDVFTQNNEPLTITSGSKYFLRFPSAQGEENLQAVNVNGVLTANSSTDLNGQLFVSGTSSFENTITLNSTTANNRQITSSYYNTNDINGIAGRSSRMYQDGINLLISNDATSGKTRFSCEDAGGNPVNIMEMESLIGTTCYRPLVILANNILQMNTGTGRINQSATTGDLTTTNNLKKTVISYSNSGNTSAIPALEIYENAGRGAYFVPNTQGGNYGPNVAANDFAIVTRHFMMPTAAICITNDTVLRNHLRLSVSTDGSLCSLVLQNGATDIANASEFRMDYNFNATPRNTISFNNPINFNPTNNGAINSNRRALTGLGTLSFTDVCGNNTTTGSSTSIIYTDSSGNSVGLNTPTTRGMFYDCSINNGSHIFRATDNNIKKTFMTIGDGDIRCYTDIYFNGDAGVATGRSINYVSDLGFLNKTIGNGTLSSIYTTNGGMFFDCGVGGAGHNFRFKLFDIDDNYISGLEITPTDIRAYESLNFNSTNVANRNIGKVGTLGFLDLSANSTEGTTISSIYTDSLLVDSLNGMYYDCGINSGFHQFKARDSAGNVSTPIYYGSNITSVSNTFIVRSSVTPSNRFDIVTDSGQNTNIRARSITASTNALININCDEVNAGGTTFNRPVMTIAPTNIEVKRPIQFNYTTTPNASTQLGFVINPEVSLTSLVASSASVRNFGSFTITNAGTYNIQVLITLAGGANHTLTENRWCLHTVASTFPSITTPTKTTPSITGLLGTSLSNTLTTYVNINLNVTAIASEIYYINYVLNYTGGSNTTISRIVSYARIG